ncbi:hypothetical protein H3N91_003288 [Salmonella enterica]|nr:hypothetical protein [Salmonella enterica]EEA2271190.1 hypothetical protein [Salmonella enterica]EFV5117780.1 hypothetical protein [Salmonella enterica]EGB7059003.1 hypothetical protein [Salmonella enterica]EKL9524209.1 hypothetical protein [Salmonella enterica]
MVGWIDYGWLQLIFLIAVIFYVSRIISREQRERDADLRAKIDGIWGRMGEIEERVMRHSDWNRAICQKEAYDRERSAWESKKNEEAEGLKPLNGESELDAMFRRWDLIKQRSFEIYPKKEVEDFLE